MIAGTLPWLELLTYQIHIPWPSNPVPVGAAALGVGPEAVIFLAGGCSAWLTIVIGPTEPVWRVWLISTMMRPEWAARGTVTSSPPELWRRCDAGDTRVTRAPGERGNTTVIPARSPAPASRSVPCTDTSWAFVEQRLAGTQLTLETRTALGVAFGAAW